MQKCACMLTANSRTCGSLVCSLNIWDSCHLGLQRHARDSAGEDLLNSPASTNLEDAATSNSEAADATDAGTASPKHLLDKHKPAGQQPKQARLPASQHTAPQPQHAEQAQHAQQAKQDSHQDQHRQSDALTGRAASKRLPSADKPPRSQSQHTPRQAQHTPRQAQHAQHASRQAAAAKAKAKEAVPARQMQQKVEKPDAGSRSGSRSGSSADRQQVEAAQDKATTKPVVQAAAAQRVKTQLGSTMAVQHANMHAAQQSGTVPQGKDAETSPDQPPSTTAGRDHICNQRR